MLRKVALVLLLVELALSFDYYLIRHGARGALSVNLPKIFGVEMQQLTSAGRSQAFFFGKEIKRRHPDIQPSELIVQSTDVDRTKQTAEYFLKGWDNFKGQVDTKSNGLNIPSKAFIANPRFLPPNRLSYKPELARAMVHKTTHSSIIKMIPKYVRHMKRQHVPQPPTKQEAVWQERMKNSNICSKIQQFSPGLNMCNKNTTVNSFYYISDLITCLQFQGDQIPALTQEEINLAHVATDIVYGRRYGRNASPENYIINFFSVFKNYYATNKTRLVLEFTHDTILFAMIRSLLGYETFTKIFKPHIICQFMSNIRFRVRNQQVRMFYNDREFPLTRCFEAGQSACNINRFFKLINEI